MEQFELKATVRKTTGNSPARELRRGGHIPAILYGPQTEPIMLAVDNKELEQVLKKGNIGSTILNLIIENGRVEFRHTIKGDRPEARFTIENGLLEVRYIIEDHIPEVRLTIEVYRLEVRFAIESGIPEVCLLLKICKHEVGLSIEFGGSEIRFLYYR